MWPFILKVELNFHWKFKWIGFGLEKQIVKIINDKRLPDPKVEAIKHVRKKTGMGIMEAKRKVDTVIDKYIDKLLAE